MAKNELKMGPSIMSPCKGCTARSADCHGKCFRYKEWLKRYHHEKEIIRKQQEKDNLSFDTTMTHRKKK